MNVLDNITHGLLHVQKAASDAGDENIVALITQILLKLVTIPTSLGVVVDPDPAETVEQPVEKPATAETVEQPAATPATKPLV